MAAPPRLCEFLRLRLGATRVSPGPSLTAMPAMFRDLTRSLLALAAFTMDPDISLQGALIQVDRVARTRGLDPARVERLVRSRVRHRTLGFLGTTRVNVLGLNLAPSAMRPR